MTVRWWIQATEWEVVIEETLETESSIIGFGRWNDQSVVLKAIKRVGDEWQSGAVLSAFDGGGTVRVHKFADGAILLEQLHPGTELVDLVRAGRDDEATAILADVIRRMADHEPPAGCPTVFDWQRGFERYLKRSAPGSIPLGLVEKAKEVYQNLADTQTSTTLLHGDLHHYNVLLDQDRGWLAIDPKGVVGELEYELGAIIRNPVELPDLYLTRDGVERRLLLLTNLLGLNYERALSWCFAQAVLSAIWDIEDGFEVKANHSALRLAEVIEELMFDTL